MIISGIYSKKILNLFVIVVGLVKIEANGPGISAVAEIHDPSV